MIKKKFKIEGMHCTACVMSIDMDLEDLDGIKSVKTSYAKQECEVEFDQEKISQETIIVTVKKTGYNAKLIV